MIRKKTVNPLTEARGIAKSMAPMLIIGTIIIVGYALFVRIVILKE